jgi:hypothetical protein
VRAVCVSALVNYSYEVLVILNLTDSALRVLCGYDSMAGRR